MAISETGHAKNVANLKTLNLYITALPGYNPINPLAQLSNVKAMCAAADPAVLNVKSRLADYNQAVQTQQIAFKKLSPFVTKIVSAFKGAVPAAQQAAMAKELGRKIKGYKSAAKKAVEDATEPAPPNRSNSQLSYDFRLDNFLGLIKVLEFNNFRPNEVELQIKTAQALYDELLSLTEAVDPTIIALKDARIQRNVVLYSTGTTVVDVAQAIKAYIISVFGPRSPQIKFINTFKFKMP